MRRRNLLNASLAIGLILAALGLVLSGRIAPASQGIIFRTALFKALPVDAAEDRLAPAAIPDAQGPTITLEPAAGPATSPVTVKGSGWQAGNEVLILIQDQGQTQTVANTVVAGEGNFSVSFFIPDTLKRRTALTIVAQATDGPQATVVYTVTNVPPATIAPQPQEPQGVVTVNAVDVRTGPGQAYPIVGRLLSKQTVLITGQNSGWWQIRFPNATGEFGWVPEQTLDAANVENIAIQAIPPTPVPPTPTPVPTPPFACNPGEWSGCGGDSCGAEYVNLCGSNGQWTQCTWDPGQCSQQSQYYQQNNHTQNETEENEQRRNDNEGHHDHEDHRSN